MLYPENPHHLHHALTQRNVYHHLRMYKNQGLMDFEEFKRDGPVLVFLHGFPDDMSVWENQVEYFKKRFHILNFNLPVTRDKKFMRPSVIISTIMGRMSQIVQQEPYKKFILIGHDLGSFILEELGHERPALVEAQILISGMSFPHYAGRKRSITQLAKSWYVFLLQIPGATQLLGKLMKNGMPYLYKTIPREIQEHRTLKSRVKTLMIFGKKDPFLNPPTQEEAERFYKDVQVKVLHGGHWIQKDRGREVNQLIDGFLEEAKREMEVAT